MLEWELENVREVILVEGRPLFPISWLHRQEYCEYQIYLENIKGIEVGETPEMIAGSEEHERLYTKFAEEAVPATLSEMLDGSKLSVVVSREFPVRSQQHGIYGRIDGISFKPSAILVIDDKRGTKAYNSDIHQVWGYCLALKETVESLDDRLIIGALREEGTDKIYWSGLFDERAQVEVIKVIERVHKLISGAAQFTSNKNPNKCRGCRLREVCDRAVV
jgi:CRISPR-associated exonuclease Cas4